MNQPLALSYTCKTFKTIVSSPSFSLSSAALIHSLRSHVPSIYWIFHDDVTKFPLVYLQDSKALLTSIAATPVIPRLHNPSWTHYVRSRAIRETPVQSRKVTTTTPLSYILLCKNKGDSETRESVGNMPKKVCEQENKNNNLSLWIIQHVNAKCTHQKKHMRWS